MLFVAGNASAALKEYEVDEKYTTIAQLDGKAFYIINESDNKALYGSNNQNLAYDVYGAAIDAGNSGYTWKIEASVVDGCYRFRLQKPNGDPYSVWGSPGYLNTNGSNAFVLGLQGTAESPREGQDIENGAAWVIEVQVDGTFAIKNYASNKYLKDNTGVAADPVYFTFCTLKEVVSSDPLATEKGDLQDAIDLGNLQNSFGKTTASWTALQDAISAGEAELLNGETTSSLLISAKDAILSAFAGLALEDGYTNLTTDMYKQWNDNNTPTSASSVGCGYVLNASTGQPYGDPSVYYRNFADISDFSKFYVLIAAGMARIQMNRETDGGTTHIVTSGNAVTEVDFATAKAASGVLEGFDFVHLNAVKDNWSGVTVTGMLLYRTIAVGASGYATFGSLYKNAKPNGVTAYAAKLSGDKVVLTEVTNVPAGKGVVIMASSGSYAPTFDVAADDIDTDLLVSNGTVVGDGTIYVLANKNSVPGFYKLASGEKVPAGKAYLKVDASAPEFFAFDGNTTGIESVKAAETKGEFFNLAGQRVAQPTKGLYIVNGKKVVLK